VALSSEARFKLPATVVTARHGDETVLLDVLSGVYYTINETGGLVWTLLGDGLSLGRVVERLAEECNVERSILSNDVLRFATALQDKALVEVWM
jgi:hypothetical protein